MYKDKEKSQLKELEIENCDKIFYLMSFSGNVLTVYCFRNKSHIMRNKMYIPENNNKTKKENPRELFHVITLRNCHSKML